MVRLLGIDPGTKRCGVAVTDSSETMAFPRPALVYDDGVAALCEEEGVELVVVGRPVSLSGTTTPSTDFADQFFEDLCRSLVLPVVQHDERLTTTAAQRSLSDAGLKVKEHKSRIDSAAAVVMLQHYADVRNAR